MKTGICKLCLLEKPLLKKSHIIPDFMYQNVREEGKAIQRFSPTAMTRGEDKVTFAPTGEYEGGILCENCDKKVIGQYEDYASKLIYAKNGEISQRLAPVGEFFQTVSGHRYSKFSNVDYKKFKLFMLSILWRASISSRPFFSEVSLGPHEDCIRRMILDSDPKSEYDYPTLLISFDETIPSAIAQPRRQRLPINNMTIYRFIIDRIAFWFMIGSSGYHAPSGFQEFTLNYENEMKVINLGNKESMKILFSHFGIKIK